MYKKRTKKEVRTVRKHSLSGAAQKLNRTRNERGRESEGLVVGGCGLVCVCVGVCVVMCALSRVSVRVGTTHTHTDTHTNTHTHAQTHMQRDRAETHQTRF